MRGPTRESYFVKIEFQMMDLHPGKDVRLGRWMEDSALFALVLKRVLGDLVTRGQP